MARLEDGQKEFWDFETLSKPPNGGTSTETGTGTGTGTETSTSRKSRLSTSPSRRDRRSKRLSVINPEDSRIVCVSPVSVDPDESVEKDKLKHCLESVRLCQEPCTETMVMTMPVNNVATHSFETTDYRCRLDKSTVVDTNVLCKSIAYKDPNTNVNHIISFENIYFYEHEFEESDPERLVDPSYRPDIDVEQLVEMKVEVVECDKLFEDSKFVYHFQHTIRVYCSHIKLQTWSTNLRPSDVVDFCDCDPYMSSSTANSPVLLQVHFQRITHHVKLVHLLCRPHHIKFNSEDKKQLQQRKQQQQQEPKKLQLRSCFKARDDKKACFTARDDKKACFTAREEKK